MIPPENADGPTPIDGEHVATISHGGRFWEVYLEFEDDPRSPDTHRGRLAFLPGDLNEGEEPARTTVIIIEPSYEEALRKARRFEDHQLSALLRSALPD